LITCPSLPSLTTDHSFVFTYAGENHALSGFYNAIELVLETGFAVTAFLSLILNLILPEEVEDEETPELTANTLDDAADAAEWERIHGNGKAAEAATETKV
jgi:hypothetical protein